jgi:hypothetical protein
MKRIILLAAMLPALASAGTLEICGRKEKTEEGLTACVDAQRKRANNLLRGLSATVLETVTRQVRDTGDKSRMQDYQDMQGRHLRDVAATCRSLTTEKERIGCEADMTYAHMENLHRFLR